MYALTKFQGIYFWFLVINQILDSHTRLSTELLNPYK
jgi:hypothetical protein